MARYFCPLCEADQALAICPKHDVPAILRSPDAAPPVRLEVGTILVNRYRLDGLLSQGGMGALLLATDLLEDRRVVVKVLKGQRIQVPANVRRFYQEARLARGLSHPNVVRIFEFGVDGPTRAPFLAMEHVMGQTLKALVLAEGPLSETRAAPLFADVTFGLAAAHDAGVLHRDLKPSNVMVVEEGGRERARVLDFGLAKDLGLDPSTAPLTQPGRTVGTPSYMAPEQVSNRTQDFRTDLYGVGCMLHAALTGVPPFKGDDVVAVMRRQLKEPPPGLPTILSDGEPPSEALVELHRRLLAKPRKDRPESTLEVAEIFASLSKSVEEMQDHLHGPTRRLSPPPMREPSFGGPTTRIDASIVDAIVADVDADSDLNADEISFDTTQAVEMESGTGHRTIPPPEAPTKLQPLWEQSDDSLSMVADDTASNELSARTMPVPAQTPFPAEAETQAEFVRDPSLTAPRALDTVPMGSPAIEMDATKVETTDSLRTLLQGTDRTAVQQDPADMGQGPVFGDSLIIPNPLLTGRAGSPLPVPAAQFPTQPLDPSGERGADRTMIVMLLLATVAVVVAIVAAVVLGQPRPAPNPVSSSPTVTVSSPAKAAPIAPTPKRGAMIRIESSPSQARVLVDGRDLGVAPVLVSRPGAEAPKTVRVELAGFKAMEVSLNERSPSELQVKLTRR